MITTVNLIKQQGEAIKNEKRYRSIAGAITRLKTSFGVNKVYQFMQTPFSEQWKVVKRILRYLRGTMDHGLVPKASDNININGFLDANWAINLDDRKSITGYCMYLGKNPVSCYSKRQTTISRSSAKAVLGV